jgi:hypothetical protein
VSCRSNSRRCFALRCFETDACSVSTRYFRPASVDMNKGVGFFSGSEHLCASKCLAASLGGCGLSYRRMYEVAFACETLSVRYPCKWLMS